MIFRYELILGIIVSLQMWLIYWLLSWDIIHRYFISLIQCPNYVNYWTIYVISVALGVIGKQTFFIYIKIKIFCDMPRTAQFNSLCCIELLKRHIYLIMLYWITKAPHLLVYFVLNCQSAPFTCLCCIELLKRPIYLFILYWTTKAPHLLDYVVLNY